MLSSKARASPITASALILGLILGLLYSFKWLQLHLARRRLSKQHNCQPILSAVPHKVPYLALDRLFEEKKAFDNHVLLERTKQRFDMYGRTHTLRVMGQAMIASNEPENVKTILSIKFKDYGLQDRMSAMGKLLGNGIFTHDGEDWHSSRAMIRPNFVREQVADLDSFERHFQDLVVLVPQSGVVDLQELFFRITIDSATEFLFGESVHSLREPLAHRTQRSESNFSWAFGYAQEAMLKRFQYGVFAGLYRDKTEDEAVRICHKFVDHYVDKAMSYGGEEGKHIQDSHGGSKTAYLFIRELAQSTRNRKRIRDELMNVLLAGRDTTASLLSNMFFMVSKQPDIWAKIRSEVEEELGSALPTYQKLRGLKYLNWCMKESLRLHPVVPVNSRLAIRDTVLPLGGGSDGLAPTLVPAGTPVNYSTYAMHRDPKSFGADAEVYRPERWESLRPGWEYLPFNGGPRICPGQQYALTEAGYVTARMAQCYKTLESMDERPWIEWLTLTVASQHGCHVKLTSV